MAESYAQLQVPHLRGKQQVACVPRPELAADEVLIHQRAAGLNGLDKKQRDLGILVQSWPHVLGVEGAGVIASVGSGVKSLQVGDEVMALQGGRSHGEPWGGAFQEYVVVPAKYAAKKPESISFEEAASLPVCYITAVVALYDGLRIPLPFIPNTSVADLKIPKSILILGGASSTGAHAIQLLRLADPGIPIYTTASTKHHTHLISLGATAAFDYMSPSLVSDVLNATSDGQGVDIVLDCVASALWQRDIFDTLHPDQSKLYAAIVTGKEIGVPDGVTKKMVSGWAITSVAGGDSIMAALTELMENGRYRMPLPVRVVGKGLLEIDAAVDRVDKASGEKFVVVL
ncbi:Enoyl LovC [Cyphellophora attinorum]|uniref:Enoyl LovC n=1 Tax=Cyphellophora attinorum TaxID=1664694 RepID=A0A0N1HG86_9EURO|nr:Enoyl LovC [Phialophora attinorum]KPI34372.1 Enoyl LovC [Phialophora attinorum]